MLCSSSCNKSFSSHSKTFCPFFLFSLAPGIARYAASSPFCIPGPSWSATISKSMLLLTRISRAFESHV
jgi:hypothetical protein